MTSDLQGGPTRRLVIAGAGGFGAEAAWVAEEMHRAAAEPWPWQVLGYVDDDPATQGQDIYGYPVLGLPEQLASTLPHGPTWYYVAVGKNSIREKLTARLEALGWRPATLIHPSVVRAKDTQVAPGTYVGALSILCPGCRVGRHVIINQRVAIGHDARIDDYVNICSGAQINGGCTVGRGALVGSNASVHPGRTVGRYASVGSNSMVIRSVADGTSVLGIPARRAGAA